MRRRGFLKSGVTASLVGVTGCVGGLNDNGEPEFETPFSLPAIAPSGFAWAQGYLWVTSHRNPEIHQIDPTNGDILKTITPNRNRPEGEAGGRLMGLAWDGEYLWVTDKRFDTGNVPPGQHADPYFHPRIYRVDPGTGRSVKTLDAPTPYPSGLTWARNSLWYTAHDEHKFLKLDPDTGETLEVFQSFEREPHDMAWDGTRLWIPHSESHSYWTFDPELQKAKKAFRDPDGYPSASTWDGENLWTGNVYDKIYKVNMPEITMDKEWGSISSDAPPPDERTWKLVTDGDYGDVVDRTSRHTVTIEIKAHVFDPTNVRVDSGTTVNWEWVDTSHIHSVTAMPTEGYHNDAQKLPDGAEPFDSGIKLGGQFSHTFTATGEYLYVCLPHVGWMRGRIEVV